MPAPSLRFGRFELQPRERRLLVDGTHFEDADADRLAFGSDLHAEETDAAEVPAFAGATAVLPKHS